ncbi:KR domain-containing protein [Camillea tinctor]|nr:KR domain-containing protein [Camillea tinctor]
MISNWAAGISFLLAYLICLSIYHLYFHPLAKVPGPRLHAKRTPSETQFFSTVHGTSMLKLAEHSFDGQSLISTLKSLDWQGELVDKAAAASQPGDVPLLIIDNPLLPLLLNMTQMSWDDLHAIIKPGRKVVWLTSGSQLQISSPSNALIHGFARTLQGEEFTLTLKTLDVSSINSAHTAHFIMSIMGSFDDPLHAIENEYCERNGTLHISRVFRDERLCEVADEGRSRPPLEEMWLRKTSKTVRMHCERIGAMDSLHFNQVEEDDTFGPRHVEVAMRAAGLNYKDIANAMGIVPENEYLLGHEGAGVITRVGSEVDSYRVGDRVAVHSRGSFSNRVRLPKEGVFLLPDSVSFEEAATMCILYFTVVYGLMKIAKLQRGQSILIHSATGGVGVASVQLCQYISAESYATAGNDEKRRFLQEQYGIPADHIFSSRTSKFAKGIRSLTGGRGVDCVLNFLTGDLLDESWRLLAANGTFVEIGKKDIIDGNTISMEPFDRNRTYRGIDISQQTLLDDLQLVERILQTVRRLMVANHIRPISPRKVFSFGQIPDAMRYTRSSKHIGKIVISNGEADDVKVPIRKAPASLNLDPKAAYLMIGGFKGLCGSLAEYMARHGAKNIISFSRSGANDERSQRVVHNLKSMGTKVQICTGDISNLKDVTRDKTFEAMTVQDYHEALASKVSGTWNLHTAAEQAHHRLSFFTMLSSISGIVGTAGQANYAAENSFQDAFASYRHSLGLAAHTVDLGIIEDLVPDAIKLVNEQIMRMLGLTSDMEESKPLNSYGMDSLAAVDLRNWFKVQPGVGLTTLDILNAGSLKALCAKAVERLIE